MRKLIGLTGPSSFTDECKQVIETYLKQNYVLLYHEDDENLKEWLGKCDAFILAGGLDIHPSVYERNISNHCSLSKFDLQRDLRELTVVKYAMDKKKPMLGICRGHQMIGIANGLKADFCIDLMNANVVHQPAKSGVTINRGEPVHCIELMDKFRIPTANERNVIYKVLGDENPKFAWVNSFHHQGIYFNPGNAYKNKGIEILATANADTPKEKYKIIELMRGEKWISCQWHPEWDYEVNTVSKAVLDQFAEMM